ncbi:unnamed protein product [Lota lota]
MGCTVSFLCCEDDFLLQMPVHQYEEEKKENRMKVMERTMKSRPSHPIPTACGAARASPHSTCVPHMPRAANVDYAASLSCAITKIEGANRVTGRWHFNETSRLQRNGKMAKQTWKHKPVAFEDAVA